MYVSNSTTPTSGDVVYTHTALVGDGATVNISGITTQGRYVRVWAEYLTANYLHLAEVKVYGCEPINKFNHAHLSIREETKLMFDALVIQTRHQDYCILNGQALIHQIKYITGFSILQARG